MSHTTNNDNQSYYEKGELPSLDKHGSRKGIIPAEVTGLWKKRKQTVQTFLVLLLLVLPWTEFLGLQTILLDIPNRKFTFFGTTLWAHEAPLIFLVLILSVLALFFVTAVWGRVWCGWACPQTVFIELIYRKLEIWIEGNYIERRKMNAEPMTGKTFMKKSLKWLAYVIVSSFIAHSVAAYFIGARTLVHMMNDLPTHNMTYFVIITFISVVLLFDFGWFREQFCIIMCPYGRFQSALLDQSSMVVHYDAARGEPRRGTAPKTDGALAKSGDCVACNRCVQVCPTGIDIRYGLQMECIACTACMDACDEIMTKVNKPKGLIKYSTLNGDKITLKKPRTIIYLVLFLGFFTLLTSLLAGRSSVDISILKPKELPFQMVKDDKGQDLLINHFKLHIKNQTHDAQTFKVEIDTTKYGTNIEVAAQENPVTIEAGVDRTVHFFVKYHQPELVRGEKKIEIQMTDLSGKNSSVKEVTILGPRE